MNCRALKRNWTEGVVEADRANEKLVVNFHGVTGVVEAEDNEAVGLQMTDKNCTVRCEILHG